MSATVFLRMEGSKVTGVFAHKSDADDSPGDRTIAQPVRQSPAKLRDWHTYVWWMSEDAPVYCGAAKRPYGPEDAPSDPRIHWTVTPNDEFLVVAGFGTIHTVRDVLSDERHKWLQREDSQ